MKKSLIWTGVVSALALGVQAQAAERHAVKQSNHAMSAFTKQGKDVKQALKSQYKLSGDYQFKSISSMKDAKGNSHQRIQQMYKGIPVWGEQVTQHENNRTAKTYISGHIITQIEKDIDGDVKPTLSKSAVIDSVKEKAEGKLGKLHSYSRTNADLIIFFNDRLGMAHLAYHVEIMAKNERNEIVRHMFIVDAKRDIILKNWNALMHIDVTGPGGNEKTGRYDYGTDYDALDGSTDGAGTCTLENANVRAVDLNHTTDTSNNTPYSFACTDSVAENTYKEINGAYSPINDAFYFGNVTFDMFDEWYDASPLPFQLSMKVHYSNNYQNAFWDGQAMTFGDGGSTFYPLVDINVSVHEVSHGFTQFNSNLIYSGEPGGINEAFSDIAGEAGEYYWKGEVDWFVGGDIMKTADGLRFFETPSNDGVSIDHYDDYYNGIDVHYSSGVFNRAYYLLANMEGWNPRTAFDVFVLANQAYWTPSTTFAEGACGVINAANDLEYQWLDVYVAMSAVGAVCTDSASDTDGDSMSDVAELIIGFDPENAADGEEDFDGDGISNKLELLKGFDPKDMDSDDDGLTDNEEYLNTGTDAANSDSDSDGMPDGWEVMFGLNPLNDADAAMDADEDGMSNLKEYFDQTDPTDANDFYVVKPVSLYDFENESLADFNLSVYSPYGFEISDAFSTSGNFSAANVDINDDEIAGITLNFIAEEGQMSFDLKTSTEANYDFFYLILDGQIVFEQSGDVDWQTIGGPISAGAHSITFLYYKDFIVSSNEDTIWIDNFYYTGYVKDLDGDTMDDTWETNHGLDPENAADADGDLDSDGLTNAEEFAANTNPTVADTDADGLSDADELNVHMTNPVAADSDGDGISDGLEITNGLNPLDAADGTLDLDSDSFDNRTEAKYGSDMNDASSIPQAQEYFLEEFSGSTAINWSSTTPESWGVVRGRLMSDPISNDKVASVEMTDVFYEGVLSFELDADTEADVDMFKLFIDGELHTELSGDINGQMIMAQLPVGEHTIRMEYVKNAFLSSTVDRVSIDNLKFVAPDMDSDNDGLTNGEESDIYGTDPMNADSDGDGVSDGEEVSKNSNPMNADSDGDGVNDGQDLFPNDASRWNDAGGTLFYAFILLMGLGLLRRKA